MTSIPHSESLHSARSDNFAGFLAQAKQFPSLLGSSARPDAKAVEALRKYWAHFVQPFWCITRTKDRAWIAQVNAHALQSLQHLVNGQSLANEGSFAYVEVLSRLSIRQLSSWESFLRHISASSLVGSELLALLQLWRNLPGLAHRPQAPAHSVRGKRQAAGLRRLRIIAQEVEKLGHCLQRNDTLHHLQSWIHHRKLPLRHLPALQLRKLVRGLSRLTSPGLPPSQIHRSLDAFQAQAFEWVRPPESLSPEAREDLYELVMHCFARYRVPRWMWEQAEYQPVFDAWAKWLMSGNDFRQAPHQAEYQLTRRMIHFLWERPHRYWGPHQILTYLYARGIGASQAFAHRISGGMPVCEEAAEVVRFLVRFEAEWQEIEVPAVIEYLRMKSLAARNEGHPYSLKGRTPRSLRRDMEAFHQAIMADPVFLANVARWGPYIPASWQASSYPGATYQLAGEWYQIIELTNRIALEQEGNLLAHCVAEYARQCALGQTAIWSLRQGTGAQTKPLITIQVENNRKILQARGYKNRKASASELHLIQDWARKVGLSISSQA